MSRSIAARTALLLAGSLTGCSALLGIPSEVSDPVLESIEGGDAVSPDAGIDAAQPTEDAAVDARPDSSADADAAPPGPGCDFKKPFGTPVGLSSINSSQQEGSARFSPDELTIYVDAIRTATGSSFGLFVAKRNALTDSFGPLVPIADPSINTDMDEYAPTLTPDGLTLVFERRVDDVTGDDDLFFATRPNNVSEFGPAAPITSLNTNAYDANPFLARNGTELWFVRPDGANGVDIFQAAGNPADGYVTSRPANINSTSNEQNPVLTEDGLTLYFASARPATGLGTNIWMTSRTSLFNPFSPPVEMTALTSDSNEYPSWLSLDGCRLYLVSNRPGGMGQQDVYVATRPK